MIVARPRKPLLHLALALLVAGLILPAGAEAKKPAPLKAGVGRADITPPTGYALGGWTRADRIGTGVHTRLQASAVVLKSGKRKIALVAVDLFAAPGGLVAEAAERARHRFSQRNVIVSASHTHSGPSQFANYATLNTLAPSAGTITDPTTFTEFMQPRPAEPQIYTFLVKRISKALRRANRDLGPAAAGWGTTQLGSVTANRSVEAHLADHGVIREYGQGSAAEDPDGVAHTIDPLVSMLRVDRIAPNGSRTPMGGWTTFANHGTVNPSEYQVYTQDHHGAALRTLESKIRRAGRVPKRSPVIGVFGNSNEGDQSAGLNGQSPSIAERVGRAEGKSMFKAWRKAGRRLEARPIVDCAGPGPASAASRPRTAASPMSRSQGFPSSPAPRRAAGRCSSSPSNLSRAGVLPTRASSRRATRSGSPARRARRAIPARCRCSSFASPSA